MKKTLVLILALVMMLCLCACGGGEPQPYFGHYNAVTMEYSGFTMDAEEGWLEIKSDTKMVVFLEGDEYSGKYELDGENFVYSQGGDSFNGTLVGDVITLDFAGLTITYLKEGATMPEVIQEPAAAEEPEQTEGEADFVADTGVTRVYMGTSAEIEGISCDAEILAELGDLYVTLNPDGTGVLDFFDQVIDITYDESCLYVDVDTVGYVLEGDTMSFAVDETMSFVCTLVRD